MAHRRKVPPPNCREVLPLRLHVGAHRERCLQSEGALREEDRDERAREAKQADHAAHGHRVRRAQLRRALQLDLLAL